MLKLRDDSLPAVPGDTVYDCDGVPYTLLQGGMLNGKDNRLYSVDGIPAMGGFYRNQCEALRARIDRLERRLESLLNDVHHPGES